MFLQYFSEISLHLIRVGSDHMHIPASTGVVTTPRGHWLVMPFSRHPGGG